MNAIQLLNIWTPYEALNVIIWLVLTIVFLYLARKPAHAAIEAFCRLIRNGLAHAAQSILSAETAVQNRNREVLFTAGMDAVEKNIEKEFQRINTVVERDLGGFPSLRRQLLEQIDRIDADYHQSSDIPPSPPEWVDALDALAKLPGETLKNKAVATILADVHKSTCAQHTEAMASYRSAVARHHESLNRLLPYWRKLTRTLESVGKLITGIHDRSARIDLKMDEYEAIRNQTNRAERALSTSSMTRFFMSGLALFIAVWGIIVLFHLIALPMAELVSANAYIGAMKTPDVMALVIILLEVSIGLYLMESLGITRLFPVIEQMDETMKRRMSWIMVFFLVVLAGVTSSLALMRESLVPNLNQGAMMMQTLPDPMPPASTGSLIPTLGQMALGFILPFVLALTAIPLEAFIRASRTVLGVLVAFIMRLSAYVLNLAGTIMIGIGDLLIRLYDLVIFPPLWVEDVLLGATTNRKPNPATEEKTDMAPEPSSAVDSPKSTEEIPVDRGTTP